MIIDYMTEIYKHPCFRASWWFPFSVKVHSANSEVSDALGYCDDELISVDYLEHSLVHSTWSANAFYHTYQFLRTSCKLNTLITTLHRLSIFILLPTLKGWHYFFLFFREETED